jgi:hypothetical protein
LALHVTAKDASKYHLTIQVSSIANLNLSSFVLFRHCNNKINLSQSSSVGFITLVVNNAIHGIISGLALFAKNNPFATNVGKLS